ncbi:MAG TPA: WcaI family glycosyltransferase [Chthoniobacterales bacterium]|jgi:colanic acid biosynthesis glycosyl transferase WcaI
MRVIVWGINYAPEVTGIAPCNVALCEYLQAQGHDVEMVTSFAYYPQWEKRPEDRARLYRADRVNGVRVHRCWHYVPRKVSAAKRILHEGTFVATSFIRALLLRKADVVVVVSPPLLLGAAAWALTTLRGNRYHFHVQDLQPDAAVGLNMLKPGIFTQLLYKLEALAYRHASKVSGIGQGMIDAFAKKGVPQEKIALLPNGFEVTGAERPSSFDFRKYYQFKESDFLAVYSGNLGVKQGLEILPAAAALVKNPNVKIVICGDGARRPLLEQEIAQLGLTNIRLLPLLADEEYRALLQTADVCLITQQAGSGNAFLPSKLLPTLAFRRAVISVADADSALASAVAEGRFGTNILPGDAASLAKVLENFAAHKEQLTTFQKNGHAYVSRFDHAKVLADFEQALR